MTTQDVIAVDLGAGSGRVMRVRFDGKTLNLEEAHRFANTPVMANQTLYWDTLSIWSEIQTGIAKVGGQAAAIGLDAWGVDFALLDRNGDLLGNAVHYRDQHKEGAMDWVFNRVPRRTVFERTGIQFLSINGLYQLATLKRDKSPLLDIAETLLTIADLFNYWLSGSLTCEFTEVTTMQCYNPRTQTWDFETLEALEIPTSIFPTVVSPGTRIGTYHNIPVIAPACHDTGSAVVAVPSTAANSAYLSSGTWSLIGVEVPQPFINDASYAANFTNEGGFDGTYRLLKNVAGLWLIQQCMQTWANEGKHWTYEAINEKAGQAEPFLALIDPDDPLFLPAGDMPGRIRDYCARTQQAVPQDEGQMTRLIYEGLVLKYRFVVETLEQLSGQKIERLHIIGGGSQNTLLSQMTADGLGIEVVTGPVEATALGNGIVQLISLGELANIQQAREVIRASFDLTHYAPRQKDIWDEAYARFKGMFLNQS